jgi:hypothetical protein
LAPARASKRQGKSQAGSSSAFTELIDAACQLKLFDQLLEILSVVAYFATWKAIKIMAVIHLAQSLNSGRRKHQ